MQINIGPEAAELHNVILTSEGLRVRDGINTILRIEDVGVAMPRASDGLSTKFVFGFSAESANSGEIFQYIFSQAADGTLYTSVYDEGMLCRSSISLGAVPNSLRSLTYAVQYNQIIVNSPDLPYPLWGFIGGSLVRASPVDSINPDTPALTLFPGLVATFSDRFVWAFKNQIIINDPGTEPRTITAPNAISFGGEVLDMFQAGQGGNLIVVCTDSTYQITPDGLQGFQYNGFISKIPGYQGSNSRNAASARGSAVGLSLEGILDIGSFTEKNLTSYRQRRRLSKPVGPNRSSDYRDAIMFSMTNGFTVSIDGKTCMIDIDSGAISWFYIADRIGAGFRYDGGDFEVISILKDSDGNTLYLTPEGLVELYGNKDVGQTATVAESEPVRTDCVGYILKNIDTPPELSPVLRSITISADRPGKTVYTYCRDSLNDSIIPAPAGGQIINKATWDSNEPLLEREARSRRHRRAVRSDSPDIELGYTGQGTRIGLNIDIEFKGQGRTRPSN